MDLSAWFDGNFQQSETDIDALVNATLYARNVFPLTPALSDNANG